MARRMMHLAGGLLLVALLAGVDGAGLPAKVTIVRPPPPPPRTGRGGGGGSGVMIVRPPPPPAELPSDPVERQWVVYAQSGAKDEPARKALLEAGGKAVDALVGLLYGRASGTLAAEEVEKLVKDLGNDSYEIREAATRKLIEHMPGVADALRKHQDDADAEVKMRVERILGSKKPSNDVAAAKLRQDLLAAGTQLFEVYLPPAALRDAAKRNLDRLATATDLADSWDARPLSPLLASLRYSEDPQDRELLTGFVAKAADGPASVAMVMMREGLTQRTSPGLPEYWKKLPDHEYTAAAWSALDAKRPKLFREAMRTVPQNKELARRLKEALPKIEDAKLREYVENAIWRLSGE